MTTLIRPPTSILDEQMLLVAAHDAGFTLVQYEMDTGQVVWEWRQGDGPRPQFVTRRVALHWMSEFLSSAGDVMFVSENGAVGSL